ncbi:MULTISPECIES: XRE family transcriptional regulator [unclassified Parabacteroides]|uniref:LexA family transcriptional regulator n=1 Tax=unclassified Parabacteroides TaxID=2649774 RepID=UPI00247567D1|nr:MULTISPECIES: XRE family transcriptional regulator [unclassified Parabacteroides]
MDTIDRIKKYISEKGISENDFASKLGILQRSVNYYLKRTQKPSFEFIEKTISVFNVNPNWLLTGEGEMEKSEIKADYSDFRKNGYTPYYSELLVSAGDYDLAAIEQKEEPSSYLKIPGVVANYWFPIIGCSMEPKIFPGDTIGAVLMEKWDRVEPDKTYLVITRDQRMVKHLVVDEESTDFLWAVSENYPKFKVYKDEILRIFRVVWAGRLV